MKNELKISLQTNLYKPEVIDLINLKTNEKLGEVSWETAEHISGNSKWSGEGKIKAIIKSAKRNSKSIQLLIEF